MTINDFIRKDDIMRIIARAFEDRFGEKGDGSVTKLLQDERLNKNPEYKSYAEIFAREYPPFSHDLLTSADSDLTQIPEDMYLRCELKALNIPARIVDISDKAFDGNDSIKVVKFEDGSQYKFDQTPFDLIQEFKELYLPFDSAENFNWVNFDCDYKIIFEKIQSLKAFKNLMAKLIMNKKMNTGGAHIGSKEDLINFINEYVKKLNNVFINMNGNLISVAEIASKEAPTTTEEPKQDAQKEDEVQKDAENSDDAEEAQETEDEQSEGDNE